MYSPIIYQFICIFIAILPYIRVRGFPERDILSLRTLGLGLARFGRPSAGAVRPIFGKSGTCLAINVFFTIGHQKRDLSAPLPGNCSELRCASFSEKCKLQKKVSVCGDNLTPYF